jgi:cysteinyl-tRNA synthetase
MKQLSIYNTKKKKKELFKPLDPNGKNVGMYVCGPTVYGDPHLGHARSAVTFDILFRYLKYLGYKVRYVRNITDAGHLVNDADEGEDKIAKKAKLEQLEPMEVAQMYTNRYHKALLDLGCLEPSIEPLASGHIMEQQELVRQILDNGFAYQVGGSVYFDTKKYEETYGPAVLSGQKIGSGLTASRNGLQGSSDKKCPSDFALWKEAPKEHIMKWPSPWGLGFPGWHCECTAMGRKYLGSHFDIHGGGLDLAFPHHECEIAQAVASQGSEMVEYWMHNGMVTIDGEKMSKSKGNYIDLQEVIKKYGGPVVRFYILQSHYRSPLDFSYQSLESAKKGLTKLFSIAKDLSQEYHDLEKYQDGQNDFLFDSLSDDLNTPALIAQIFELPEKIKAGEIKGSVSSIAQTILHILTDILGLLDREESGKSGELIGILLKIREEARQKKDWELSDKIRDSLKEVGIKIEDTKDGTEYRYI